MPFIFACVFIYLCMEKCVYTDVSIFFSMLDIREFEETKIAFEKPEEHLEAQCLANSLAAWR